MFTSVTAMLEKINQIAGNSTRKKGETKFLSHLFRMLAIFK